MSQCLSVHFLSLDSVVSVREKLTCEGFVYHILK